MNYRSARRGTSWLICLGNSVGKLLTKVASRWVHTFLNVCQIRLLDLTCVLSDLWKCVFGKQFCELSYTWFSVELMACYFRSTVFSKPFVGKIIFRGIVPWAYFGSTSMFSYKICWAFINGFVSSPLENCLKLVA